MVAALLHRWRTWVKLVNIASHLELSASDLVVASVDGLHEFVPQLALVHRLAVLVHTHSEVDEDAVGPGAKGELYVI